MQESTSGAGGQGGQESSIGLVCPSRLRVELLPGLDPGHHAIRQLHKVGVEVGQPCAHLQRQRVRKPNTWQQATDEP